MYKRMILLLVVLIMLTGCTELNDSNIDDIIGNILVQNQKVNTVSTSYEIYLPNNVISIEDNDFNQILRMKDKKIYLYVDTTSYYFKNILNFELEENKYDYFYKKIANGDKTGYIGISKEKDDYYYCKIIYNYAKIEFYSDYEDLDEILVNSLIMINSIKYNDQFIKAILGDDSYSSKEMTYEFVTPKGTSGSFSEYLQEFVEEEETVVELPDEE